MEEYRILPIILDFEWSKRKYWWKKYLFLDYFLNYLSDYYFKRKGILIDAPRKKSQQYKQDEVFFFSTVEVLFGEDHAFLVVELADY